MESLETLRKQRDTLTEHITKLERAARENAFGQVEEIIASAGISAEELVAHFNGHPPKRRKGPRSYPPKYRNPESPEQTWSGRGHQPIWVKEALASGKSLEEFAITSDHSVATANSPSPPAPLDDWLPSENAASNAQVESIDARERQAPDRD